MFLILAILAFSKTTLKENAGEDEGLPEYVTTLLENLNGFLNNGVNKATFESIAGGLGMLDMYNYFIGMLSNKTLQIHEILYSSSNDPDYPDDSYYPDDPDIKEGEFSDYIDLELKLTDKIPELSELLGNSAMVDEIASIVSQLGPNLAKVANIDFGKINNVFNYVFYNKNNGNDGITIKGALQKLGLPTDFVPQFKKVIANFDSHVPISTLFDGLNVKTEYEAFVTKVEELKVPESGDKAFFSVSKVLDAVETSVDLITAINTKFIQKYKNELLSPVINSYALKAIDFSEASIYDRGNALLALLNTIKGYESSCSKEGDLKCVVFSTIQEMALESICDYEYDENYDRVYDKKCEKNIWSTLEGYIKPFASEKANYLTTLNETFGIDKNTIAFIFGLVANLTDTKKSYLDIIEGLSLIMGDRNVDFLTYHNVPYRAVATNVTSLVKFMNSVDDSSNFKLIFDYLNVTDYWYTLQSYVDKINKNTKLCEAFDITDQVECNSIEEKIKSISGHFISTKSLEVEFPEMEGILNMITGIAIPALKHINNNMGTFLTKALNDFPDGDLSMPKDVDFNSFITKSGKIADKVISLVDNFVPLSIKQLPIVSDIYPQMLKKVKDLLAVFANNNKARGLLDSLYDGTGVIVDMLSNAANAYVDQNTAIDVLAKGMKPTSFLNVYETAKGINGLTTYGLKSLINSIKYDGSSAKLLAANINLNDVVPVKTVADNSDKLASDMAKGDVKINVVADSLGVTKDELKNTLGSAVKSVSNPPAEVLKEAVKSVGGEPSKVDNIFNKIAEVSDKTAKGEDVDNTVKPKKKGLSAGAIAGIVIACVVVVGLAVFLGVYFGIIRKRNNDNSDKQNDSNDGNNENI